MSDTTRSEGHRRGPSPGADTRTASPVETLPLGGISLLEVINVVLRHRRLVLTLTLTTAAFVVFVTFISPRSYSSGAAFMPQSTEGQLARLSGLAAQFGFRLPTSQTTQSPEFYADLLDTRTLLEAVAETSYRVPISEAGSASVSEGTLLELYEVEEDSRPRALLETVETLRGDLDASTNSQTGLVRFSIRTPWPTLSRAVAERMLELVHEFNTQTRQSQAAAERRFLADRIEEAQRQLEAAEDSLEGFLNRNREFANSPTLTFLHDRLQRRVELHQQVLTALAEAYEQAKIDEVRNVPVITVVEAPRLPVKPDRRYILIKGLLGIFIGAALGILLAFAREALQKLREQDSRVFDEFRRLRHQTRTDIRNLLGYRPKKGSTD